MKMSNVNQQIKARSTIKLTDWKFDEYFQNWIDCSKVAKNRSKVRSQDQKLDQQIKS